jgi:hypothetical protein
MERTAPPENQMALAKAGIAEEAVLTTSDHQPVGRHTPRRGLCVNSATASQLGLPCQIWRFHAQHIADVDTLSFSPE